MTTWLGLVQQHRVIAVIRAAQASVAYEMALAAAAGGIRMIEITWNTDKAEILIPRLQKELPDRIFGTGTILDLDMAQRAIACGCKFMFMPHIDSASIELANAAGIPVIAGALTPTEILTAWQVGATAVKVFPVKSVGGIDYLNCIHPVLGHIPLIPSGGVSLGNAYQFLQAGAIALCVSSSLFPVEAVAQGDWAAIASRCQSFVQQVQQFPSR